VEGKGDKLTRGPKPPIWAEGGPPSKLYSDKFQTIFFSNPHFSRSSPCTAHGQRTFHGCIAKCLFKAFALWPSGANSFSSSLEGMEGYLYSLSTISATTFGSRGSAHPSPASRHSCLTPVSPTLCRYLERALPLRTVIAHKSATIALETPAS